MWSRKVLTWNIHKNAKFWQIEKFVSKTYLDKFKNVCFKFICFYIQVLFQTYYLVLVWIYFGPMKGQSIIFSIYLLGLRGTSSSRSLKSLWMRSRNVPFWYFNRYWQFSSFSWVTCNIIFSIWIIIVLIC